MHVMAADVDVDVAHQHHYHSTASYHDTRRDTELESMTKRTASIPMHQYWNRR